MPVLATWADTAGGVQACIQSAALILGGIWAYFKFLRGQPFASRALVDISAKIVQAGTGRGLEVKIELRNVGATRMRLNGSTADTTQQIEIAAVEQAGFAESVEWGDAILVYGVFENEEWIEAGETLRDELLVPVPTNGPRGTEYVAYRVFCEIEDKPRRAWYQTERIALLRPARSYLHGLCIARPS